MGAWRGLGYLLQGALYPGPSCTPHLSAPAPTPSSWASALHRQSSKPRTFSRNKAASACALSLAAASRSVLLRSMLVRSTVSRGCRAMGDPALPVLTGEELGSGPAPSAGQPSGALGGAPHPLQVDHVVTVRAEWGRELPRAGSHLPQLQKPASGEGLQDQEGGNRRGPVGTGPWSHHPHYGDIPRRQKEALDLRNQGQWHSHALAPTPAVQAACHEASASQVCCPRGEGELARARLSSLDSWQF